MNSLNIYERLVYISISELNLSFQQTFDRLHRKEYTCAQNLTGPLLFYHTFMSMLNLFPLKLAYTYFN